MKPSQLVLSVGLVALVGLPCFAQENQNQPNPRPSQTQIAPSDKPFMGARAKEVIGKNVENELGKKIGDVNDLLIDIPQGRVAGVVVGVGGLLGVGEQPRIVPPQALECRHTEKKFTLRMDEQLQAAKMRREDLKSYQDLAQVYRDFQQSPYWEGNDRTRQAVRDREATTQTKTHTFQLRQAKDIIGSTVENPAKQNIGEVEDVIIDFQTGRILFLAVSAGGFLGVGDKLVAVPPGQFHMGTNGKLVLNTTEERLKNAPQFDKSNWPNLGDPAWASKVYGYYGETIYWNPDATKRQPVREREEK